MKEDNNDFDKFLNVNANPSSTLNIEEFKHAMKLGREREEDLENIEKENLKTDSEKEAT